MLGEFLHRERTPNRRAKQQAAKPTTEAKAPRASASKKKHKQVAKKPKVHPQPEPKPKPKPVQHPERLLNGNLNVPFATQQKELGIFVDGFTEVGPDHPDYEKHLADVERQERRERREQEEG